MRCLVGNALNMCAMFALQCTLHKSKPPTVLWWWPDSSSDSCHTWNAIGLEHLNKWMQGFMDLCKSKKWAFKNKDAFAIHLQNIGYAPTIWCKYHQESVHIVENRIRSWLWQQYSMKGQMLNGFSTNILIFNKLLNVQVPRYLNFPDLCAIAWSTFK